MSDMGYGIEPEFEADSYDADSFKSNLPFQLPASAYKHQGMDTIDGGSKRHKGKRTRVSKKKGRKSRHTKRKKGKKSRKHKVSHKKSNHKRRVKHTSRKQRSRK